MAGVNPQNLIKGKKIIGSGYRRIVYDLGNGNVIKVAKSTSGFISNKSEVIIYHSCPAPVKQLLGEIIDYDNKYRWVKMKKYHHKLPHLTKYKQKLYKLRRLFLKYGIIPYEVTGRSGRPNYQNLRLKANGEIIVIDYGNFKFRKKYS